MVVRPRSVEGIHDIAVGHDFNVKAVPLTELAQLL